MKLLQELFASPDIGDQIVAPSEMVIMEIKGNLGVLLVVVPPFSVSF